jgi:transglutaminase-like putative cysteine protease
VIEQARLWATGRVRRQTLLSLALLLILFGSLVYGVSAAVRGIERGLLWPLVFLGLPLGWLLACSRVRGWLAALVSLVVGVVPLALYVGQLGGSLATLLGEAANFAWQVMQQNFGPDAAPIQAAWVELSNGASILVARLYTWLLNLVRGQPVFDPVPITLLWSMALWGTIVWAGWAVRRRAQVVWAVAPAVGLLASTLAYVGGRAWYLLPMLASTLVLRALVGHDTRRQRWEQDGMRYPQRVRSDTIWLALGLSSALMIAAAITPSVSVARLVEWARDLTEVQPAAEEVARSLGLESQPEPVQAQLTILDARRSGGLPTRHLIGSGPELSERVVMVVSIESAPTGAAAEVTGQAAPSYYWRGLTYDRYTDRGWSTEYAGRVKYAAGEAAIPDPAPHRQWLRQKVHRVGDESGLLYVAGALATAEREFRVAWRLPPGEEMEAGDAYGALIEADTYRADSLLPVVGEADLRAAGQDYPAWVVERYWALPDSVPDRVLALARDLTATERTPYDRALAIERYLRRFPYTLDLPSPPADRDVVDYFLFDLQQGYCDYYATAMVVLARAAGLPARLVTGYAAGTYEAEARYVVTEADAHAWPEVYFPGYGWIEFEPTAGLPAIERPADALAEVPADLETSPEPIMAHRIRVKWAWWLGAGGALLLLALASVGVWWLVDGWQLRHLPPKAAVLRLYQRLYRYGRWLGVPPRQGATPREFAAVLGLRLTNLAGGRRWSRFLNSAPSEIHWLTDLCTRALYSLHHPQGNEQKQAIQTWSRLRRRLWLARLITWAPW